ncbi:MAG: hypothetical protein ACRD9S_02340 [Pyrinomonadaceae bacterium]
MDTIVMTTLALTFFAQVAEKAAAASPTASPPSSGLTATLDIAAVISAVFWPIVVLVILLVYRKKIPSLVQGIAGRITKLGFAGISFELAKATAFAPDWTAGALDLRQKATALQVNDSTAASFSKQLMEGGTADYAEVNLGTGQEWLTSRLLIMAIVFARMKGIQCLVFVETAGNVRRCFVGWADPEKIRWALARHYPWLEQAYASAYSETMSSPIAFIVTNQGGIGQQFSPRDPGPTLELIQKFLLNIQLAYVPTAAPPNLDEWIPVDPATNTYEHASWINSEGLEQLLGNDLHDSAVRSSELRSRTQKERLRIVLSLPERFQAVVKDDQRFEYLLDRSVLLEQVAEKLSSESDGG